MKAKWRRSVFIKSVTDDVLPYYGYSDWPEAGYWHVKQIDEVTNGVLITFHSGNVRKFVGVPYELYIDKVEKEDEKEEENE